MIGNASEASSSKVAINVNCEQVTGEEQHMAETLQGQTVIIFGASSGIGRATAELAARAGARVMAVARRADRLQRLSSTLQAEGRTVRSCVADVMRLDEVEDVVLNTLAAFGSIDIAVYATGTNAPDRAMSVMTPTTWTTILDTNLTGAFHVAYAVLPAMRAAGTGHILFVSSTAGAIADLSGAAYQASKRGMLGLAHAIRLEERAAGIRTCCILPGLTNTELVEKRPEKLSTETLARALQPEDVAQTILHVMQLPPRVTVPELLIVPTLA